MKERFTLPEEKMVPYLEGEYTLEQAQSDLKAKVQPPLPSLLRSWPDDDRKPVSRGLQ